MVCCGQTPAATGVKWVDGTPGRRFIAVYPGTPTTFVPLGSTRIRSTAPTLACSPYPHRHQGFLHGQRHRHVQQVPFNPLICTLTHAPFTSSATSPTPNGFSPRLTLTLVSVPFARAFPTPYHPPPHLCSVGKTAAAFSFWGKKTTPNTSPVKPAVPRPAAGGLFGGWSGSSSSTSTSTTATASSSVREAPAARYVISARA